MCSCVRVHIYIYLCVCIYVHIFVCICTYIWLFFRHSYIDTIFGVFSCISSIFFFGFSFFWFTSMAVVPSLVYRHHFWGVLMYSFGSVLFIVLLFFLVICLDVLSSIVYRNHFWKKFNVFVWFCLFVLFWVICLDFLSSVSESFFGVIMYLFDSVFFFMVICLDVFSSHVYRHNLFTERH